MKCAASTDPVALRAHAVSWKNNNFNKQAKEEKPTKQGSILQTLNLDDLDELNIQK